jgi:peptidyl-prolyl cis-trans isomerase SurA
MRVILLLLVSILSITATAQLQTGIIDKVIAVVGDKIILQSDITIQKETANGSADEECMFIEQAMISKILMVGAEKDSLPVTDDYVEEFIARQKIKETAKKQVKEYLLAEAMKEKIIENIKITPSEVEAFFNKIPKDKLPIVDFDPQSRNAAKHTMNLTDDYEKIATLALDQKRMEAFDSWFITNLSRIYVEVDDNTQAQCEGVKKFVSTNVAGK